ncbi:hypothetical protein CASFOL_038456 [Castilleja foliolosa]|uniref:Uncharacterized protein n=1 Tax=Castilleja foliolosa TaxID=1961234 RepID=A0ABD3BL02_9LAMI
MNKKPTMVRVSSFTVACAHLWTCVAKAAAAADNFVLHGRRWPMKSRSTYVALLIVGAVSEVIGEAIRKNIDDDTGIMDSSMKSIFEFVKRAGERMLRVGVSPRLDFYGIDYGWGRPVKYETLLGDDNVKVVYFSKSEKYGGGIEIGVSMPKVRMDAFAAFFDRGIREVKEKLGCKM